MHPHLSRRRWLGTCVALGLPLVPTLQAAHAATPRLPAPDFELPGPDGAGVKLSALRGKVVYLDFWASWCGPCRQSFPWMNELQARLGPRGLQVLGVNLDAKQAEAKRFLADVPARFQLAFDEKGATPRLFGVKGMPTSVLIDREGRIAGIHAGFQPSHTAPLEQEIALLLEAR